MVSEIISFKVKLDCNWRCLYTVYIFFIVWYCRIQSKGKLRSSYIFNRLYFLFDNIWTHLPNQDPKAQRLTSSWAICRVQIYSQLLGSLFSFSSNKRITPNYRTNNELLIIILAACKFRIKPMAIEL
jgi:hypothetical protein